jgi:nitroreductase
VLYQVARMCAYDCLRFLRHGGVFRVTEGPQLLARITAQYHVLEKGLSFRDSKPLFGQSQARVLMRDLLAYLDTAPNTGRCQWESGVAVLESYLQTHEMRNDIDRAAPILQEIRAFLTNVAALGRFDGVKGGYVECHRESICRLAKGTFPELATSRSSVRHFSKEPVPEELISQAVQMAQKSPSACNRQTSRVHALCDKDLIRQVLEIQCGTRGFTEQIDKLLVVTGDLRVFLWSQERNQVHLDNGLFSMSLLFGLHYLGVGACPLHWCVAPSKDRIMRRLVGIPEHEAISMLVAVGSLPDDYRVAHSQRNVLDDVLTWHRGQGEAGQ